MKKIKKFGLLFLLCGLIAIIGCAFTACNGKDNASYDSLTFYESYNTYTVEAKDSTIAGEIIIPAKYNNKAVRGIRVAGFMDCKLITSVVIPEGITGISVQAFDNCTSLTSITIPVSVTNIYRAAFYNCKAITTINYAGTKEQWSAIEKGDYWIFGATYTIYCSDGNI